MSVDACQETRAVAAVRAVATTLVGTEGAMANSDSLAPCPNFGGGGTQTHNYEFKIYALDTATITVTGSGTAAVKDAEAKLEADNLASATLGGTSDASPP